MEKKEPDSEGGQLRRLDSHRVPGKCTVHLRYKNFNSVLQTVHEQFSALDAVHGLHTYT